MSSQLNGSADAGTAAATSWSIGLSVLALSVYESLMARPSFGREALAVQLGTDVGTVDVALAELSAVGLVVATRGSTPDDAAGWQLASPEPALGGMLDEMNSTLQRFRGRVEDLLRTYHANRRLQLADSPVEIITDADALGVKVLELQRSARVMLRGCDRPPYYASRGRQGDLQREVMAGGVVFRTIYDTDVLQDEALVDDLRGMIDSGEQARLLDGLPIKMLICDDAQALIATEEFDGEVHTMLIHRSGFLQAVIGLFETMWRMSDPLMSSAAGPAGKRLDQVLVLLRTGATDQAIARYLGVSQRTVERYVQQLMEELGAKSRFQAGVIAARRGVGLNADSGT